MFTSKAKQQQKKQPPAFPAFLQPVQAGLLALKQQQLDSVREMFTLQEELFTHMAATQEQTAVYLAELLPQVRTDPARVESDLLKLAEALSVSSARIRRQWDVTRQVLNNIGGPRSGK